MVTEINGVVAITHSPTSTHRELVRLNWSGWWLVKYGDNWLSIQVLCTGLTIVNQSILLINCAQNNIYM